MKNTINNGLKAKRIVLLGGSSGIGLATALAAAREGAAIVIVSSSQQRIEDALSILPKNTQGFAADLGEETQVEALFKKIGKFDHLVFTAGDQLKFSELSALNIDEAKKSIHLRFWGSIMAAKYGAPLIRKGGSITLTTGAIGKRPRSGTVVIAGMASAIDGLTRSLAFELAPIRVNAVCVGTVRTNLLANMPEPDREALFNKIGSQLLTGKVGDADDLAEAYVYLMRGGFTTGQVIVADGGSLLV
ncbi:SDR family oxidoreductase [Pedobacter nutrimenti]|jgi:NAD(P)-dependent dehydrogenase (short-subunit alcohol dehydrogenase family)|uniref:NAD(P)-dependent dehydrogenase (Short-subunit alcohol dehydrogenase family) n=1 Tax=Pedobacter nutrimenti TaxID=1241337 RepID=A0A318UPQ4_9SPHI|nr:SDR family oxidoreductase [Pedobacter nutrimenti]PYF77450.1 NAD(P)-dependent dehydrogenase (short-subunit alcohol dehydrogenase family) [Pedobacter nutrimenti]